jgi:hypothetical protein
VINNLKFMEEKLLQEKFNQMAKTGKLFESSVSGDKVWETYLSGFEKDPIFRDPSSSYHRCNTCKHFFRRYGNIVAINPDTLELITMFDSVDSSSEYKASFELLSKLLKSKPVDSKFAETLSYLNEAPYEKIKRGATSYALGLSINSKIWTKAEANLYGGGVVQEGETSVFHHFSVTIPASFIDKSGNSIDQIKGESRSKEQVFRSSLDMISLETLLLVKDLIDQDSILDGKSHLWKVDKMISLKKKFDKVSNELRSNWCWLNYDIDIFGFKNELIGKLCLDIQDEGLEKACLEFNKRVDPANYMKAKSPITKKQIEEAKNFVESNGYLDSFTRRVATIDDIKTDDILHLGDMENTDVRVVSIFDNVKPTRDSISSKFDLKNVNKIPETSIKDFMATVLPNCEEVELYLQNKEEGNLVTITTADKKDSKPIFKWSNNFSWTYKGNLAGKSLIKTAVKNAGGFVDAPFRFSIMWNESGSDIVDLDAHAIESSGDEIYYASFKNSNKRPGTNTTKMTGQLDIDMIDPEGVGVENIYWTDLSKLKDGVFKFFIHNYDGNSNPGIKRAEIFFSGDTYQYIVPENIYTNRDAIIAKVHIKNGKIEKIEQSKYLVNTEQVKKTMWGLESNNFYPINLICKSPNRWKDTVGNLHYFFMIKDCKPDKAVRSFHIENLKDDLVKYRKVMEVLGNTTKVSPAKDELSGLGFDETVRDEVILRIKTKDSNSKKIIRVKI